MIAPQSPPCATNGRRLESGEGGMPEDLEAPVNPIALF
jgi:hypothetical protein